MAGALGTGYDPSFPARWVEAMKKPSRAGGNPPGARPRKASKLKGSAERQKLRPDRVNLQLLQVELARFTRELNNSLKRETATADVLKIISC